MDTTPEKNVQAKRFELNLEGKQAVLEYEEQDGETLVFTHTFVPPELRGKNVAAQLTRYALEDAKKEGKKVVAQCSYVAKFMTKNKQYQELNGGQPDGGVRCRLSPEPQQTK